MKVCVADDHAPVRAALHQLLVIDLDVDGVVEAASGEEAVRAAEGEGVGIVLMDVHMPGGGGVAATQQIRERMPRVRVVALTVARDAHSVAAMIAAGADSYLVKTAPPAELRESLRDILDGRVVLAPEVLPLIVGELARRLRAEQERADALDELDRTKREFISLVSDQLRNPLTAISGYTKTLCNGWGRVDDATKQEFLGRIDEQAGQLARRVEQILTVTRLEAGEGAAGMRVHLDSIAREALARYGERLGDRAVDTRLEPVGVVADRRGLTEVAAALVDNALVHGEGVIAVRVRADDEHAVLEVEDEGPGIAPDLLPILLSAPFTPGDLSDTRSDSGMGLSLYIARRVVENAGGHLELSSAPGGGTRAQIRLPRSSLVGQAPNGGAWGDQHGT